VIRAGDSLTAIRLRMSVNARPLAGRFALPWHHSAADAWSLWPAARPLTIPCGLFHLQQPPASTWAWKASVTRPPPPGAAGLVVPISRLEEADAAFQPIGHRRRLDLVAWLVAPQTQLPAMGQDRPRQPRASPYLVKCHGSYGASRQQLEERVAGW